MIAIAKTPLSEFVARVTELLSVAQVEGCVSPTAAAILAVARSVVQTAAADLDPDAVDVLVDRVAGGLWRLGFLRPWSSDSGQTLEFVVAEAARMAAKGLCAAALIAGEDLAVVARELRWVG